MKRQRVYLAVDLGAESGRVVAGLFDGKRLSLEEIHRFPNGGIAVCGAWHWDVLALFAGIKKGLAAAVAKYGRQVISAGVDTWGVDYALIDNQGKLLALPCHYRDGRTNGMMDRIGRRMSRRSIYEQTGIQFMFFNTINQLYAEKLAKTSSLAAAKRLLFMPDLFHYWLTGCMSNERTNASTSQLYDPNRRDWAWPVIRRLGLPERIFGPLIEPATSLGFVTPEVAAEIGTKLRIVVPASHDTQSAIAAVPAAGDAHAYISSGTSSLMGIETPAPVITDRSYELAFANEVGIDNRVCLLKNMCGLWLLQECRRTWAIQGDPMDYAHLTRLATAAKPRHAVINLDDPLFIQPGDMPAKITSFCKRSRQPVPRDKGEMVRLILQSMVLRYKEAMGMLDELAGSPRDVLHVVGGGSQNQLLNQLTADAIGRPVITGPVEATSAGNILAQMLAQGDISSLVEGRTLIRRSFATRLWQPQTPV